MNSCPECGSNNTKVDKEKKAQTVFSVVDPLMCDDCGNHFDPPIPKWAPYGLLFVSTVLLIGAAGLLISMIAALFSNEEGVIRVGQVLFAVACLAFVGAKTLIKSLNMISGKDTSNTVVQGKQRSP